jgi:hypothetical protein
MKRFIQCLLSIAIAILFGLSLVLLYQIWVYFLTQESVLALLNVLAIYFVLQFNIQLILGLKQLSFGEKTELDQKNIEVNDEI